MQTVLNVEGMSCSHCEAAVKKAVGALPGVAEVSVSLAGKTVTVAHGEGVGEAELKRAIEDIGYDVV
ncbi:MAG: cation transporter [Oscillospiraceae bacterium]|jgi:copper chaperone|nr:cation transporter [Oscillospiraceae bacterium]